ncbi:MAG: TatD DNase family protein [Parasphingorhabdus sp.]|jgi:TatD DNase family protein
MDLVDSHCHIDFEPLGSNTKEVLQSALNNSVKTLLCVSVNMRDFPKVRKLADEHENVFASVGVHPNEQDEAETLAETLVDHATSSDRVVAIGETGLDYFRSEGNLDWQRKRFSQHITAAKTVDLPLIIHMRDATEDTLKMMKDEGADQPGGVMHCFAEDWPVAKLALDLGFYISFSGIVTFKNALDLKEVARNVPEDRMLVETDSPYLAPVPFRGKVNQPAYVLHTAECIAELRSETVEHIAEVTTNNFFNLFKKTSRIF